MAFLAWQDADGHIVHYPCGGMVEYLSDMGHYKCEKCRKYSIYCAILAKELCAKLTDYRYEPKPKPNRAERRKANKEKPNATH